ncbi:MAG: type IV pilin protein [Pseudomonadota bacterium]
MQNAKGFTLIELMIAVVIVAILAAVAVPSYQSFIQDGRRAECKGFVLDIASRQERFFTQNSNYAPAATFVANLNMPNGDQSENGFCRATVATANADTTFTIEVAAEGWADRACSNLTLTNTGLRGLSAPVTGTIAECWR